ncbi:carboxymuconolactone decarboxylase family protein [Sandaracinobacteroides saxicola]|uniref:Carboxymuconolactone decarboxylase family protein n=1 Tax=Sandaracinobacteroides saxicola TaxID=2759707 RepID=A0A7G5II89_9SPHN|nr:carboxymuconolactone decarboxylase family protein [Sandaracinobacteroides saxicola]QMW23081.1 carboxymuconolactone decarboxylase family protein [Sandaracinobacteroides saxicola]
MPNPSITPIPRDALPADLQPLHDTGVERTGDATIIGVMAHQPDILRWYFGEFYDGLFYNKHPGMTVDVRSKELLRLKLSKQHGCQFCNRFNTVEALAAGITQAQVDAIYDPESPVWDAKDRAVIALAEEMMLQNMEGHLSPALHARLWAHYSEAQIIELGFIAAVLTGVAKWIFTFDMVNREEICPIQRPALAAE